MNEILSYVFMAGTFGTFYLLAFLAAALLMVGSLIFPRLLVFGVLAVVAVFPSSASNFATGGYGFNAYGKGGGYFFFSVFEMAIIALFVLIPVARTFSRPRLDLTLNGFPENPYSKFYLAILILFLGYLLFGLVLPGENFLAQFGRGGVINIFFQGAFVSSIFLHFREPLERDRMLKAIALLVAAVMLWGALRYVALGGDPQGSYESESGSLLKITFWDVNYSIWAAMLAGAIIWHLSLTDAPIISRRLILLGFAVFLYAVIALSARRTAQIGAVLSLLALLVLLPNKRRWMVLLMLATAIPLVVYKLNSRIGDHRPVLVKLLKGDQRQQFYFDPRYERTYELRLAWAEIRKSPLFGVGPTGDFNPPSSVGIEYHKGNYGFIHSGFGHVLLKFGFVGLFFFLGIFLAYARVWMNRWKVVSDSERMYLVASLSGMLCAVPNLLMGTPIIEIRSMIVLALCLALPLIVGKATDPVQSSGVSRLPIPEMA